MQRIADIFNKFLRTLYLSPKEFFNTIIQSNFILFIFVISVFYTTIFNVPIYYIYKSEGFFSKEFLMQSYFLTILLNFVIFLSLALFKVIFYIAVPLLFLLSAITTFLIINFKVKLNMNAVALIFETNLHEASGVAGIEMIISVVIALIFSLIIVFFYRRYRGEVGMKILIYLIIFQTLCINLPAMKLFAFRFRGIPNDLYLYGKQYLKEKRDSIKMSRKRVDLAEKYRFDYKNKDLLVVLIIGEAERSLNFSSNGYTRETDPNLKGIGAISYSRAYSCGTITRVSIPCMLTRATFSNQSISKKEKSVISIFNRLGFETYWISNQGVMGEHETPITPIINESKNKIFVNISGAFEDKDVLDENIIPVFENIIKRDLEKALIVINLIGSHWYYEHHYTEKFRKFTPICKSKFAQKCSKEELYNSYDNSLLYTDWVVSEIMKRVSDKNGIVYFISDHGESLGEDGIYTHWVENVNREEQRSIAWFVYITEEYKKRYPDFYRNIRDNKEKYISHDNLFHSLLDCATIESEVVDKTKSICREIK